MTAEDKRKHKRVRRRYTLRVTSDNKKHLPTWSLVSAHDLSAGGVMFTSDQPFQLGESLLCKLKFMDRLIECKAKVVRFSSGQRSSMVDLAVVFEGLSPGDEDYISHFNTHFGHHTH